MRKNCGWMQKRIDAVAAVRRDAAQARGNPLLLTPREYRVQSRAVLLRWSCILAAAAILLALGAYAWDGRYVRYSTDDFCTASTLHQFGFTGAMRFWRNEWSGRYAYYAVKAIPESIGEGTAPLMPALMIALFCAASIWTMRRIAGGWLIPVTCALAIVFAAIDSTPDILLPGGPLMWETGVLTYLLPVALTMLWVGVLFSRGPRALRVAASAVLMFAIAGLSETSLAAQAGLVSVVLAGAIAFRAKDAIAIASAGFLATLLGAGLAWSAPGNAKRMAALAYRPRASLFDAILDSCRGAFAYPGSILFGGAVALVAIAAAAALFGSTRTEIRLLLLAALAALTAFVASLLPAAWMTSGSPPPRALLVTTFFFAATLFALAAAAAAARPRAARTVAPLLFALTIAAAIHSAFTQSTGDLRRHKDEYERIERILRENRGRDVVIRSPYAHDGRYLFADPRHMMNRCLAEYYGVRSLSVTR